MEKAKAIDMLGGSITAAAEAIGISYQAVDKWPDPLPQRIEDRVLAALWRKQQAEQKASTEPSATPAEAAHG